MDDKYKRAEEMLAAISKSSKDKDAFLVEKHPAINYILDKIGPLNLNVSSSFPHRVNILIGIIDFKYFFGGYISVFNFAKRLTHDGYSVRMIIVDECPFEPLVWKQKIAGYEGLEDFFDQTEVVYAYDRSVVIECNPDDTFIATSWWTAFIANDALKYIHADRFVYLTQEYEPIFSHHCSIYALIKMTYDLPHYAIFSTELLRDFHRKNKIGLFKDEALNGEERSVALSNAIVKVDLHEDGIRTRKKKRVLFYARPEAHAARNLFELGILALSKAVKCGTFDKGEWEFHGIGTLNEHDIILDADRNIRMMLLPKMNLNDYKELLTQFDVGISLMLSPHPSLVPTEMASAGMIVVTNTYANKTAERLSEISTNFVAAEPTIDGIVQALGIASTRVYDFNGRINGAKISWPQSWDDAFNKDFMNKVKMFIDPSSTLFSEFEEKRLAKSFINIVSKKHDEFVDVIHPDDQLYNVIKDLSKDRALYHYLKIGNELIRVIKYIVELSGKAFSGIDSFLEVGGGYGVLTRFCINEIDPWKIWVCNTDRKILDFQKKYFSVNTLSCSSDPFMFDIPQKFETIFISSLFSHMSTKNLDIWLTRLFGSLKEDGMLIFVGEMEQTAIEEISVRLGINNFYFLENGVLGCRNLYIATKKYIASMNRLNSNFIPHGNIDKFQAVDGKLLLYGWAVDYDANGPVKEVNVYQDGSLIDKAVLSLPRQDVKEYANDRSLLLSGWEYKGKLPSGVAGPSIDERVIVELKSNKDISNYLISNDVFRIEEVLETISKVLVKGCDEYKTSTSIWDNSKDQHCRNSFKVYWELLPEVAKYQLQSITGKGDYHYFEYLIDFIKKNIGDKNLRGLSIGCQEWDPAPEVILIERGLFTRIEVVDIAESLLEKQARIALEKGIKGVEYIKQDCNELKLEENVYDLIFAVGTVHHIEKLDSFFKQINRSLKRNGIFVMREYVGPNRIQFTEEQLLLVNEILSILPEKYRITFDGLIKNRHINISEDERMAIDQSESVCSKDIIPLLEKHLDVIKMNCTGGTILHPLMNGIASNFEKGEDASTILKLLIFFEKTLIEKGVLPSDYIFCLAGKKDT